MATCIECEKKTFRCESKGIDGDLIAAFNRANFRRIGKRMIERSYFSGFVYTWGMYPWGVVRVDESSNRYTLRPRAKEFESELSYKFRLMMIARGLVPLAKPLCLSLIFAFGGGRKLYDLSKLEMAVEDAGTGILWLDDMLIAQKHSCFVQNFGIEGVGIIVESLQ